MAASLKRPRQLGVKPGINLTPLEANMALSDHERGASITHALKKNLQPFGDHTAVDPRARSGGDSLLGNVCSPQLTSQQAADSKLPLLRQRNPLGSPIAVSLQSKGAAISEDCRATEAYGAPPRRPMLREPPGQQKST